MGSSSQPKPEVIHPGEAAQAATGTAAAGEQMSIANQPIEQFGNLATTTALGPAEIQTQTALANQAAYQSALAQRDIQARTDPLAFAQREMRLRATTGRYGQLTGQDPNAVAAGYRAPSAYMIPGTADLPTLDALRAQGAAIASNLSTAALDKAGTNPRLVAPKNPTLPTTTASQSYF